MWPILTVSFLLQLTDEEQLFAQQVPQPAVQEVAAPAPAEGEDCPVVVVEDRGEDA